jgi:hypothetical protein
MSENLNLGDNCCCKPAFSGLRQITFADGSKEGVIGLEAVMEDLYCQGKPADPAIGMAILELLKKQNYFAPAAHPQYAEIFSREYRQFLKMKIKLQENNAMTNQDNNQNAKKKGFFNFLKGDKKAASEGGCCCNMKIVPSEQPAKESPQGGCCNMKIVPKESTEDKTSK